ncbi:EF-P 5-aminopentanol modification-associated protein YfmH [Peptostreptococcus equinus]|uniref:Pitrilysin family protein n=1 Tax=Peptostreptococcus equinus TaxID=3003601 RepID=A0ABY7JQG8_9FIRM|nr:pitrilysin family protein [Peptostreptococcus sp. CBA3647]WAW15595.1 pitrilysin family protein [Peptostreptococcus sp. CBA3647]
MKKIFNETINEILYYDTFENGLELYFMPKRGFESKYAVLGVDFGSNDLEFIPINEKEKIRVSDGIAHFLEHKMFEQPDESNAFDEFSKFGASANAFTSFTMTAYLFSATENFYPSLRHLINYVQTPYYTEENVNKEKGIIAQEINMYRDDPEWNVYMNCLKAMYASHHTSIDIAGSVESINKITPEELYKCYNTFYNPANMKLFVVGDLDEDELFNCVRENNNLERDFEKEIKRFMPSEQDGINTYRIEEKFAVSMPLFYIGYKDNPKDSEKTLDRLKKEISTDILFDIIFSESGDLHSQLYDSGLITGSIYGGYLSQKDYSYALASGSSNQPDLVKEKIDQYIDELRRNGIKKSDFEINKKKKIGGFLKSFDSISFIANNFLRYMFRGINFLDYLQVLKNIELSDIEDRLDNFFLKEKSVISIVSPKK